MISDQDLLLYHYEDGLDATERERIGLALRTQPELNDRLRDLVASLDRAAHASDVDVPGEVQERWRNALAQAVGTDALHAPSTRGISRGSMAAAAALVLVVALGVVAIGKRPAEVSIANRAPAETDEGPTRFEHGMRWQLASAERQLEQLGTARGEERAQLIEAIIAQNRLYAAAAERAGDVRLARALHSFAPILDSIASAPADTNDARGQLAQLNFELRVMQARLAADAATASPAGPVNL